jgi:hypothetical protein
MGDVYESNEEYRELDDRSSRVLPGDTIKGGTLLPSASHKDMGVPFDLSMLKPGVVNIDPGHKEDGGFSIDLSQLDEDSVREALAESYKSAKNNSDLGFKTFKKLQEIRTGGVTGLTVQETAEALVAKRRLFLQRIVKGNPSQQKFLKGWMNRVDALEEAVRA